MLQYFFIGKTTLASFQNRYSLLYKEVIISICITQKEKGNENIKVQF